MGDRVAVLQKGGVLAQYATPAELLMSPANDFVEDFVGRRPRAQAPVAAARARHRPVEGAARASRRADRRGARADRRRRRAAPARGGRRGTARSAGCRERDLAGETVPAKPDAGPEPILELDDVLRDALSDLLQSETQYGPVVDEHGRVAGVLSVEIISHFLSSPSARAPRPGRARRRLTVLDADGARPGRDPRAQRRQLHRAQRLLPGLDRRQLRPLHRTRCSSTSFLTVTVGRDRVRDRVRARAARAPPALADRPDRRHHRRPLHAAEPGRLLPAAADHRARHDHGGDRAHRVHAPDHLPQHHHRPRQRARGRHGRRPRDGADRSPAAVARGAAARRCRTSSPGCGSPPPPRSGSRRSPCSPGAGGLGEQIVAGSNITFKTGVVAAGGLAVLLALALDVMLLAVQRVLTPWRRAQPGMMVDLPLGFLSDFSDAIDFIFNTREAQTGGVAGGRAGRGARLHVGAREDERRRDRRRLRDRDPGRARARARRQGRAARDQHLEHRPRGAEPGADRVLRRLPRRRLHERDARARAAGDPADPDQHLRGRAPGRPGGDRRRPRHGAQRLCRSCAGSSCRWRCRASSAASARPP